MKKPAAPRSAPEAPVPDDRLDDERAFRRFVGRVTPWAYRWLVRLSIPEPDRDDLLQDTLASTSSRRDAYDPAAGSWEQWCFGHLLRHVKNYRKRTARRLERVVLAPRVLPDTVSDARGPDEEADLRIMRALLARCLEEMPADAVALLKARAEGLPIEEVAEALGISRSTAYEHLHEAEAHVRRALADEQKRKRALGLAVSPLSLAQLLASEGPPSGVPAETMAGVWKHLERAINSAIEAGRLRDDETTEPRTLGRSGAPGGDRSLRGLRHPWVTHGFASMASLLGGVLVTYQVMRRDPLRSDTPAELPGAATVVATGAAVPRLSTGETSSAGAPRDAADIPPEPGDAGAPEPTPPSGSASTRATDGTEQGLYERAMAAYERRRYGDAITALEEHARRYPHGQFAGGRERLFLLALVAAGRRGEARRRIEQLRRSDPDSPALAELDRALGAAGAR